MQIYIHRGLRFKPLKELGVYFMWLYVYNLVLLIITHYTGNLVFMSYTQLTMAGEFWDRRSFLI